MQAVNIKAKFGTTVRQRRHQLGITQEELAGRAGLHRTYVTDIERGTRNVSLENVQKLACALEVPVAALFPNGGNGGNCNGGSDVISSPEG